MKYLRVTEILSKYQDFGKVPEVKLIEAMERGNILHKAFASYALNLWTDLPEDLEGYFESFKNWFDKFVTKIFFIEKRFHDPIYFVTGQLDLGCILKGDKDGTIVDWKSGISSQKAWEGQMAIYQYLANNYTFEGIKINFKRSITMQPKKDGGKAKLKEYINNPDALKAFLNASYAHRYFIGD